ncbi:MAG: CoA ester lyase [Anaerolineae bacterium]|nr:CoA ester lyase [Anaerolineae bacterium]
MSETTSMDEIAQPVHWRALLFMPGDDRRKIEKALGLGVDAIIMDLEDGVALNRKDTARLRIASALNELSFGRQACLVRINSVSTPLWQADLESALSPKLDAIVLPKVEHSAHIKLVSERIAQFEQQHGLPLHKISLLAIIETAMGVINLAEIASTDERLSALVFGAEDLAGDIGATRTPGGEEVFYARSAVVLHAKAHQLAAIDTPFVDFHEAAGLLTETERALRMGYTGKLAIHPNQIEIIQQTFTPTPEEIQRAQRLIVAHDLQQAAGSGVFAFDGKMVDMPMIRAAQTILARAKVAGITLE